MVSLRRRTRFSLSSLRQTESLVGEKHRRCPGRSTLPIHQTAHGQCSRTSLSPRLFSHWIRSIPLAFIGSCANLRANPFAKAGIEGALWDAYANARQMPLHELFGIERRPVPSGVAIGIFETIDELIERVRRYVTEGYRRVKIKIQPGWDIEPVAAVRAKFPELPLMVDANAAYTIDDLETLS